jgi:hypothetical protein
MARIHRLVRDGKVLDPATIIPDSTRQDALAQTPAPWLGTWNLHVANPAGDADFPPRFSALVYQAIVGPPTAGGAAPPATRR